ncbi:MAG: TIGR04282 family arsenosugar biosynthesis glycosyltransferase [Rubrobacter sp.]|nr:TIGR04282 family arsenosugar biosynthesis glycosyltransferase [Rubrobacter sp.]MBA3952789.1 TIGR04282 family arsenosugar biosynthesis glycosyltransferase [Rubrobacter sp.]
MTHRILVMAKAPIPGTVKTRLGLHPQAAAQLQAALIRDTVGKARSLAPTTVSGAPAHRLDLIRALLPDDVNLFAQELGDLGGRMLAGVQTLFAASSDPVLLFGTDAPTLPAEAIERAASALASHDISIIQSSDGGYVLLGLRRPVEAVFRGVDWSTEAVFRQTLQRADGAGLSVYEGDPWYDVDEPGDLARLREELGARPERAPWTADVLGRL